DSGETLIFEITHTELRKELTGDDIAIRKDIHSRLDCMASRLILGRLVAPHDEGTHVVRIESGIVSKLQLPLRGIDPGDLGVQLIDEVRVKSEVVRIPAGLAFTKLPRKMVAVISIHFGGCCLRDVPGEADVYS